MGLIQKAGITSWGCRLLHCTEKAGQSQVENSREDFSLCLKHLRGILPVLHQQKLCGGSDGNAVDKAESGEGRREGSGGGPGPGEPQVQVKKQSTARSPKTTCQSTSASTLLNEAGWLHFHLQPVK